MTHCDLPRLEPGQKIAVRLSPTRPVHMARFERYGDFGDDIIIRVDGETQLTETSLKRIVMRTV